MKNKRTLIGMMAWLLAFAAFGLMGLSAPVMAAPAAQAMTETELTGPVQMRPVDSVGEWTVAGIPVTVDSATVIEERVGPALVGAWVQVEGTASAGAITAHRLKVVPAQASVKLAGILDDLSPTSATVDSIGVGVDAATLLVANPTVGEAVGIKAAILDDGSLLARRIQGMTPASGGDNGGPAGPPELGNTQTEVRGVLQSMDLSDPDSGLAGVWRVSGITVTVALTTEIDTQAGPVVVGGWVKVKGAGDGSGGLDANEAKVVDTGTVHKLAGILAELTDSSVTIDGITVALNSATIIDDTAAVGQQVEVLSQLQADGTMLAVKINAGQQGDPAPNPDGTVVFVGTVESLPAAGLVGQWVVSGQTLSVTLSTEIDQAKANVAVGVHVKIDAVQESDGSLTAVEIHVLNGPGHDDQGNNGNFIKFTGLVVSLPPSDLIGQWVVAGRTVSVTANTQINQDAGPVAVGVLVKVEGYRLADGTVRAQEIEVKDRGNDLPDDGEIHVVGVVEARPVDTNLGSWIIAGRGVEVTTATLFDEGVGPAALGARVKVEGMEQADGTLLASRIKTLANTEPGDDNAGDHYAKFRGIVVALPATPDRLGVWQIQANPGVTVTVNVLAETFLDESAGPIELGSFVEVEGAVAADGSVVAAKIELKLPGECECSELEFVGIVVTAPASPDGQGAWVIRSGMGATRTVTADGATVFEGGVPVAGDLVEVNATVQADGSLLASKIDLESHGGGGGGGPVSFTSPIVSFPADLVGVWQVGAKTVTATAATEFDQEDAPFAVGVLVEVTGTPQPDGTILAERIVSKHKPGPG